MSWFTTRRNTAKRTANTSADPASVLRGDSSTDDHATTNHTAISNTVIDSSATDHAATDRTATDRRLIRAIVHHGSQTAADQLVRTYFDDVLAFIWRITGDRDHALDLTQETMIAALRSLAGYNEHKASLRTWLYTIASHKVIDARRSNQIVATAISLDVARENGNISNASGTISESSGAEAIASGGISRARDPADIQSDLDLLARIDTFVGRFDAGTQEIFHLRTAAGLSFTQIAATRGEHTEAVKARYYRLIQAIRKEFDDERSH